MFESLTTFPEAAAPKLEWASPDDVSPNHRRKVAKLVAGMIDSFDEPFRSEVVAVLKRAAKDTKRLLKSVPDGYEALIQLDKSGKAYIADIRKKDA